MYINKGNCNILMFEIHKSIEQKNKSELQTQTKGITSNYDATEHKT